MLFAVTGKKLFFFFSKSNHNTYKNITRIPFSPPGYVDYAEEGTRAIFCTSMTWQRCPNAIFTPNSVSKNVAHFLVNDLS